jgi:hypothetical protein
MTESQLEAEGLATSTYAPTEIVDKKTLDPYYKRLKVIDEELERATLDNDDARLTPLREERSALLDSLSNLGLDKDGKKKKGWDPDNRAAQKRLRTSINRAIDVFADRAPDLAAHFRGTLKPLKFPFSYNPEPPIPWQIKTHSLRA